VPLIMPGFQVDIPHTLSQEDARARLEGIQEKLSSDYGVKTQWSGPNTLVVARKGLDGTVEVAPDKLAVSVKLGFLMAAMAGPIREGITKKLTKIVAD